ncbi:glycoside hydrolase family 3 N-terminal domain-containing protein [Blautia marasmi]|uniref:glycoside hydrolase family 3 N-terminal domain-containing protein n=1 Tax=Blautia marasmi TaxID=1917868 RepID=UPI00266BC127|nr:glycoside hydrolase family 3 N-terminal domain-containing protein [Blautia marasmi]
MEKYLDRECTPKERAKDLLSKMSLEEKMGQVNCLFPLDCDWDKLKEETKHGIGQISTLDVRQIESLEEVAAWQRKLQEMVMKNSEHHIPAIFHMEGLCGAFIQGGTSFPSGIGRGATWNPQLEKKVGQIVGRQELSCGITQVLAPVLDISRDSRMGRQGETYGEDPALAAAMGVAYTKGIQDEGTAGRKAESMAKHFLGFHNSQGGIHGANCDIPDRLLDEVYGKPFQAAISEADLRGIMPCYCSINGEPLSASKKLLTGVLRDEMGFDGICGSDYTAVANVHNVQKIGESVTEAGLLCMSAGMDVEMQNCIGYNEELQEWFRTGKADIKILDRAVLRVLEAKFRMGLFEHPFALEQEELRNIFHDVKDRETSLQSALESMVLVKNNGALPLPQSVKKIALIGCHAKNPRSFFGGYTHLSMSEAVYAVANSIAGMESGDVNGKTMLTVPGTQIQCDETEEFDTILKWQKPECRSLLEELREKLPDTEIIYAYGYPIAGDDTSHMEEALEAIKDADIVIMTLGGKHGSCSVASMGEGVDSTNINLPICQDTFIKRAAEYGKPMVGIHFDGRPVSSDVADQYLDAILEAWNPSECGAEAITRILTGEYNPGGKMPVSTAYCAGQSPIYYNHPNGSSYHQGESIGFKNYVDMPHTPRYFFGHGLSYTKFSYSDLKLDKKELEPDERIRIEITVENVGEMAGDEVVQVYICDRYASMTRPVKELAGFFRTALEPKEKKTIAFTMMASQFAFLDKEMKWKVEKGEMEVQVGSSSEDIRLTDTFTITQDAYIEGRSRGFYAQVSEL